MAQAVLDMLGGSFDGIVDANLLPWAQLAWGAGGAQADTAVAASLVQGLDWQEMAFTLPGPHSLTVLLDPCHAFLLNQTIHAPLVPTLQKAARGDECHASGDVEVIIIGLHVTATESIIACD